MEKVVKDTQHAGGPRVKKGKHVPAYQMISHGHSRGSLHVSHEPIHLYATVHTFKRARHNTFDACDTTCIYEGCNLL